MSSNIARSRNKKRTKETKRRKPKQNADQRHTTLEQDSNTVKLADGQLKGTPHVVYCRCKPGKGIQLDKKQDYILKNWESHQTTCEMVTGVKAGSRTKTISAAQIQRAPPGHGITAFFKSKEKSASAVTLSATNSESEQCVTTMKKIIIADQRLDAGYFSGGQESTARIPPPPTFLVEVECLGLHGDGYRQYAWQKGGANLGGLVATEWIRISRILFPYKDWKKSAVTELDAELSDSEPGILDDARDALSEKTVRAACAATDAVERVMSGVRRETNTAAPRSLWTEYETKRLNHSLELAAGWRTEPNTGAVYAMDCRRTTTNITSICFSCTALARHRGLQQAVRRARTRAQLPPAEFAAEWERRQKYTPRILNDNAAVDVKNALANPAVLKILSSKATHGPGGAFLALYNEAQSGNLDDRESFVAICNQFADKLEREKDASGRKMKGIRYSPEMGQVAALMRSYGPRSGAQYDLLKSMIGGVSQRQLRRRVAKSALKMSSSELCAENLEAAVEFGKLMRYEGPWVCAGDGTKLRPLLSTSTEYSEPKSAHVVGSTLPLADVLFKSAEEQSRIISRIDEGKAIATQVWVLAITIPLPNMPVFPVAFIPNKGTMTAEDYFQQHSELLKLCGSAGLKLLASAADGARAEFKAQQMMTDVKTGKRLTYTYLRYGIEISCPVYDDTGPHIPCTDLEHCRKGVRNNFLSGTHLLILGCLYLCHAVLMLLLSKAGVPLYIRDIFNPEKQDDGAARRLFVDTLFQFLVDSDGNIIDVTFEGLFVLTFIFGKIHIRREQHFLKPVLGELFDAYMKRGMPHIERVTCVFRARHFLIIWRANVVSSESLYPDLFQKQSSFIADATFQILIRLCDQFILLVLAHSDYYPDVPLLPRKHGSGFVEHFFGVTRTFIEEFTFGQLIQMNKHITYRQRILVSGKFNTKKEKESNNGYIHDCDSPLTANEIAALKILPSRADLDRACDVAWREAAALAKVSCGMAIPELPLTHADLHPNFRPTTIPSSVVEEEVIFDVESGSDDESQDLEFPVTANEVDFELDSIRVSARTPKDDISPSSDEATELGINLTVSQSLAHAAHHIVSENYLADLVAKDEEELEAIDRELDANPEIPVSGRMALAFLLNSPPPSTPDSSVLIPIPTFLEANDSFSRHGLIEQRRRHCATSQVHSEQVRKPGVAVEYLGGKFSLNHAAHQLKEAIQQSEGLRNDTAFQKARYRRWIVTGAAVEWRPGCRLDVALSSFRVPKLRSRGVDAITPIRLGSLVVMRSAIRLYLGEVLGIYRYGSVSGKHESYTDAETVDGLSYLSLRVYEQISPERNLNLFQHKASLKNHGGRSLALFTHAPISEFVYLLTGAKVSELSPGVHSISGGDSGWECWDALNSEATYRILDIGDGGGDEQEEEEDYEEPDEGTSTKKRRPKAPRGAVKRQKTAPAPTSNPIVKLTTTRTKKSTSGARQMQPAAPKGKAKAKRK
ncbi:hypothetical protein R3P38DRAFT_3348893 [Favolaschia claudopus]|uniref:Uncharacterized protein n=1 Tax=Favolaschia claudopus TaxID=2862362 RepID=A0AAW0CN36_9AGAR